MVLKKLQSKSTKRLFENLEDHSDSNIELNHYINLIRCIADEYLWIKQYYATSPLIDKSGNQRKRLNKLILNTNQ